LNILVECSSVTAFEWNEFPQASVGDDDIDPPPGLDRLVERSRSTKLASPLNTADVVANLPHGIIELSAAL